MKVNIQKGLIGYVFLFILGIICIITGGTSFGNNVPSAIFSIVLGLVLLGIGVLMSLRKN